MSVKNKVKRLNKRIAELEKELEETKQRNIRAGYNLIDRHEEEIQQYKDNFIKLILNERKGIENNCCRCRISERLLETMKNAKLEVEKNYIYLDSIDFILRI